MISSMAIKSRFQHCRDRGRRSRGILGYFYRFYTVAEYRREISALRSGQVRHMKLRQESRELYSLRRHVHMLEKGLVMRPRRSVFAEAYIEETVRAFSTLTDSSSGSRRSHEYGWFVSVLSAYFDAVSGRESPAVSRAHLAFKNLVVRDELDCYVDSLSAPFDVPSPGASPVNPDDLYALISKRSSVRWFLDKPVSRDILDRAAMAAAEAPSACNRQPYRMVILDESDAVQTVAKIPGGTAGYAENIPCLVVFVGDVSAFSEERDRHLIYIDSSLAAMSFILALESEGVGSCCINWPDVRSRDAKLRKVLNLADHESATMLLAVGYADPTGQVPSSRKRSEDSVRQYNDIR